MVDKVKQELKEIANLANLLNSVRANVGRVSRDIDELVVILEAQGRSLDVIQSAIIKNVNALLPKEEK